MSASNNLYLQGNEAIARGLALFDTEWTNIKAGQAWAVAHTDKDPAAAQLCRFYPDAGVYALDLRLHQRERIRWLEAALKAARQLKHSEAEGVHLGNLGNAYADLGEMRKAIAFYEQRLAIARKIYSASNSEAERTAARRGEANALGNLGSAYKDLGETRKAIEFCEQVLMINREIGHRRGESNTLATSAKRTQTWARRARRLPATSRP